MHVSYSLVIGHIQPLYPGHGPFSHMFDGQFIPKLRPDIKWKVSNNCVIIMIGVLMWLPALISFFTYSCNGRY